MSAVSEIIFHNIRQLVTSREIHDNIASCMGNIEILENAYLAISEGKVLQIGTGSFPDYLKDEKTILVNCSEKVITPGFVDSHTHLVHYGSRENELKLKLEGVSYLDILKAGGGILSTVKATRDASFDDLVKKAKSSLDLMLSFGVTTVEAKSGYGLNLQTEIKQLEVSEFLNKNHPIDIVSTFMGAHAVPTEFKDKEQEFITLLMDMMSIVKEKNLAEFCDVFCEDSVFDVNNSRKILLAAKKLGYKLKIHADEIISLGGAELAGDLGCVSADHLMAVSDLGIDSLKANNVIANILPGTSFNLGKPYAPVRKMIDKGVQVAISSDYNPGSCPTQNLQLVMQIASSQIRLTPKEILKAVTLNGARSICREDSIGSLEIGKKADLLIFDVPNIDYIFYNFGINHLKQVYKNGKLVFGGV